MQQHTPSLISLILSLIHIYNQRRLGDTANDIAIYGNKIYVVVNVSSTVEVIDFPTGKSIRQISMLRDNGSSRQPRAIAFDKDKAYVCSYDGTVEMCIRDREITPELLNPEGATYSWLVNGKEYSTEPTFSYKIDNPCRCV